MSGSPCSRPARFTQMECDGHLAQCLSEVNVDVTWWANRKLAAVPELRTTQMPRAHRRHIMLWRTRREKSLVAEAPTPETDRVFNTLAERWGGEKPGVHLLEEKLFDWDTQITSVDKLWPACVGWWWRCSNYSVLFFNFILLFSKVRWFQAEMTHSCQVFVFRQCDAKCSILWTPGRRFHRCGRDGADNRFWSFITAVPVVMKVDVYSSDLQEPCMKLHLAVK